MVDKKYYTPDISEFHVGFEYEILEMGSRTKYNPTTLNEWDDLTGDHDGITLLYEIARGGQLVRVKYLDKEDIESLRLKLWQIPGDSFDWEFYLDSEKGESIGKVTFNDNNTVDELEFFGTIFHIKNKSELKRILKQLGI